MARDVSSTADHLSEHRKTLNDEAQVTCLPQSKVLVEPEDLPPFTEQDIYETP